jgi:hypothetical protein
MSHSRSRLGAGLALAAVAAATLVDAGSSRAGETQTVYTQTNLVSNLSGQAAVMDANLQNAWGVAFAPGGPFWVNDNNSGLATLYRGDGTIVDFPNTTMPFAVVIPTPNGMGGHRRRRRSCRRRLD